MRNVSRSRAWTLLPVCLLAAACATRGPVRHTGTSTAGDAASRCKPTTLNVVLISNADATQRANIEHSARRLSTLMSTSDFVEACAARPMNRTRGRSVASVCRHVACAGPKDLKIGLYHDADMPTVAFEKRGVVFLNAAKSRAGSPSNLAHEFAHVLGYSHVTWWGWWREDSVPYALADVIETIDRSPRDPVAPRDFE